MGIDVSETFCQNVDRIMRRKGLRGKTLATALSQYESWISNYLRNPRREVPPGLDESELQVIAHFLNVPEPDLIRLYLKEKRSFTFTVEGESEVEATLKTITYWRQERSAQQSI